MPFRLELISSVQQVVIHKQKSLPFSTPAGRPKLATLVTVEARPQPRHGTAFLGTVLHRADYSHGASYAIN
jgi:hypothetical protein